MADGGSLAGGLASFGGSLLSGLFNASQAAKTRAFQKKVLQTRYQWQVDDLRKAGINPMLAPTLGGSSAPSSAAATMPDLGSSTARGVEAGLKSKLNPGQKALLDAQQLNATSAAKLNSDKSKTELQKQRVMRMQHPHVFAKELLSEDIPTQYNGVTNAGRGALDKFLNWSDSIGQRGFRTDCPMPGSMIPHPLKMK